ncbi:RCC1 domain-containing protein [Candidatus Riflebacteria bacterium]
MNRNYVFLFSIFTAITIIGCGILSNDDDAPAVTTQEVTMSGKVEFPETAGTTASIKIRAKVDFTKYRVYINGVRVTLNDDGTYTGDVPEADEYVIEVRFAGSKKAILKATASKDDEGKEIDVDVKTTAKSLAYEAFKEQAGKSDKNFKDFEELVDEIQDTIDDLADSIEKVLQSVSNLESEDFDLEEDEEVKSKTEEASKKAEEEEAKQATSSTTTSSTTTSTAAVDTTTTSSSTSSTTAVELPAGILAINDGAATTDSVNVILNLTVTQAVGVITMSVDGGDFEALNMAKSHTLSSGDGDKTVTIILKDDNGQSESITDTITLDTTPPFTGKVVGGSEFALLLKSDKTLWSQGYNGDGRLGDGTTDSRNKWVQVGVQGEVSKSIKAATGALTDVVDIAAGYNHAFALKSDGTLWGWGDNSGYAKLGGGYTVSGGYAEDQKLPVQVGVGDSAGIMRGSIRAKIMTDPAITDVTAVAAGFYHSLALKSDGTVWSWGYNNYGQTGTTGSGYDRYWPEQISGISGGKGIAAGRYHSLAVDSDGTVWAWGYNYYGQLGILSTTTTSSSSSTSTTTNTPTQVKNLSGIVAVAAGYYHSLALKSDGTVWAWGRGDDGQLGTSTTTTTTSSTSTTTSTTAFLPVQVPNLSGVVSIAAGRYHSLAMKSDGTIWGWGNNSYGQVEREWNGSLGQWSDQRTPKQIQITDVVAIGCGYYCNLFLLSDGTVKNWGPIYDEEGED